MKNKWLTLVFGVAAAAAAVLLAVTGCSTGSSPSGGGSDLLYITDTFNGNVFTYDIDAKAASTSVLSINEGAGDWIGFHNGIGFVSVGNTGSNNPGVYWFDPSDAVPAAARIGSAISAGAIAFYSDTKAYVIDRDKDFGSGDILSSGVYTFDPSNPGAGLTLAASGTTGAGGQYFQDIVVGTNGMIYVSDHDNQEVLEIDPAVDNWTGESWSSSASGTTGLLPRVSGMSGDNLLYVANSGGTIDLINITQDTVSQAVASGNTATQIVYHAGTGTYYAAAWNKLTAFTPMGPPPYTPVEVTDSGSGSVGGNLCLVGDLLFVTTTDYFSYSRLVVFDASTASEVSYSPVEVGTQGSDAVTGITQYQ
jgi:sugar lactone lactonase YvrE